MNILLFLGVKLPLNKIIPKARIKTTGNSTFITLNILNIFLPPLTNTLDIFFLFSLCHTFFKSTRKCSVCNYHSKIVSFAKIRIIDSICLPK